MKRSSHSQRKGVVEKVLEQLNHRLEKYLEALQSVASNRTVS